MHLYAYALYVYVMHHFPYITHHSSVLSISESDSFSLSQYNTNQRSHNPLFVCSIQYLSPCTNIYTSLF
eukprot:UN11550